MIPVTSSGCTRNTTVLGAQETQQNSGDESQFRPHSNTILKSSSNQSEETLTLAHKLQQLTSTSEDT
ncbi:hypothetical protein I79_006170 [Cricetulus griseus]|uniref:Uncharacterized protein n=1 Tax=Cricetulus griseus TaxID=10029 RepID=G3H744_CRIGR|nr:hypothetical protein I79_006170 [Cricetulus griseus]